MTNLTVTNMMLVLHTGLLWLNCYRDKIGIGILIALFFIWLYDMDSYVNTPDLFVMKRIIHSIFPFMINKSRLDVAVESQ